MFISKPVFTKCTASLHRQILPSLDGNRCLHTEDLHCQDNHDSSENNHDPLTLFSYRPQNFLPFGVKRLFLFLLIKCKQWLLRNNVENFNIYGPVGSDSDRFKRCKGYNAPRAPRHLAAQHIATSSLNGLYCHRLCFGVDQTRALRRLARTPQAAASQPSRRRCGRFFISPLQHMTHFHFLTSLACTASPNVDPRDNN